MNRSYRNILCSVIFTVSFTCCYPIVAREDAPYSGAIDHIEFREQCTEEQCEKLPSVSKSRVIEDVATSIFFSTSDKVDWSLAEKHGDRLIRLRISSSDTRRLNELIKARMGTPINLHLVSRGVILSSVIAMGEIDGEIFIGQVDGARDQQLLVRHLKSIEDAAAIVD